MDMKEITLTRISHEENEKAKNNSDFSYIYLS